MTTIERVAAPHSEHEEILRWRDPQADLHAIAAIHSSALGPAVGGTRWQPYPDSDAALHDALRLSSAMTKKAAVAGLQLGGGKAVVIGDHTAKTDAQLRSYAEFLNQIGGRFITTTDVGTTTAEIDRLHAWTPHILGLSAALGGGGDTSALTAATILAGMRATFEALDGDGGFAGRRIVVIGLGKVGAKVASGLADAGAQLRIADIRSDAAAQLAAELSAGNGSAEAIPLDDALSAPCDLLSPNALGGILSAETIPALRCRAICGAANNQLAREPQDAELLAERGILYAPDYVVNSGGLISVAGELFDWPPETTREHAERVYDATREIFRSAAENGITPTAAAEARAANAVAAARNPQPATVEG